MIIHGKIQSGLGIGKKIGFPTLNLVFEKIPALEYGVYAAYAWPFTVFHGEVISRLEKFSALVHFGPRPTIHHGEASFEVYFLEFPADGKFGELFYRPGAEISAEISVEILGKIRDTSQFDSLEDLTKQIEKDRKFAVTEFFS